MIAAQELEGEGIHCEVIDVASLKPLDLDTIIHSIEKTKRCVIVHEAAKTSGFGGEISALIMEHCFKKLKAPVERVTGYDVTMPYFQLEKFYIPSVSRIKTAVHYLMEYK